jgi:hypothetical protein
MDSLQLVYDFTTLVCADEADGPGDAEPYMWTAFFKIDGSTCHVDLGTLHLTGKATVVVPSGNEGDLGVHEVDAGQTVKIPAAIGHFATTMVPIPLGTSAKPTDPHFGGVFGAIGVLLEEDSTKASAIAKGHAAFKTALQSALDSLIPTFGIDKQTPSADDIKKVEDHVLTAVTNAVKSEIGIGDAIGACFAGNCQDEVVTVSHFLFSHGDLDARVGAPLSQFWHSKSDDGDWKINTHLTVTKRLYDAVWRPSSSGEVQWYGMSYSDFHAKNVDLRNKGMRVHLLNTYFEQGTRRYDAVWRPMTVTGEYELYNVDYATFQAEYNTLWKQNYRIALLNTYVVNGATRYDAIWRPGSNGEIQLYGLSSADFKTQYTTQLGKGLHLYLFNTYELGGRRYDAVWRPGSGSEQHLFGATAGDFQAKYDALWKQNYRLALFNTYVEGSALLYDAVWRPGTNGEVQWYRQGYSDYQSKYDALWKQNMRVELLNTYER